MLLVPGNPDRLGTIIYIVIVDNSRPVEARYTTYMYLLCKSRDQGRQGTSTYVVTVETSCHGKARHAHLRSYLGNLKNASLCALYFRSGASR